ncbi:hypothetical protein CHS0354_013496 [Potamilus streckersoni]|uniref:C2H2-type domain-containing protein n=1 Tax=Potamilus streckersoni TaxID=2493646 RepID=A0AAE0W952_9BIVA|nr:hypothetical protein CHS0354_013496 [Potamilus streckersoni]
MEGVGWTTRLSLEDGLPRMYLQRVPQDLHVPDTLNKYDTDSDLEDVKGQNSDPKKVKEHLKVNFADNAKCIKEESPDSFPSDDDDYDAEKNVPMQIKEEPNSSGTDDYEFQDKITSKDHNKDFNKNWNRMKGSKNKTVLSGSLRSDSGSVFVMTIKNKSEKYSECEEKDQKKISDEDEEQEETHDASQMQTNIAQIDEEIKQALLQRCIDNNTGIGRGMNELPSLNNENFPSRSSAVSLVYKFICKQCDKSYASWRSYKEHRRQKHPFQCDQCSKKFAEEKTFDAHMRAHYGLGTGKIYDCPVCGKISPDSSSRVKHMRLHTGEKPYKCEICGKRFTQTGHLHSHMRIHNGEKPYSCPICNKFFSERSSVKRHLRKVHYKEHSKKCEVCNVVCNTLAEYRDHLKQFHKQFFTCEICQKDFPDSRRLKLHQFTAHEKLGENAVKLTCEECGKKLYSKQGLKRHMRRHHAGGSGEKISFNCGMCDKSFRSAAILERHMLKHVQKQYICVTCNKVFNSSSALSQHRKAHAIEELKKSDRNLEQTIVEASLRTLEVAKSTNGQDSRDNTNSDSTTNINTENLRQVIGSGSQTQSSNLNENEAVFVESFPDIDIQKYSHARSLSIENEKNSVSNLNQGSSQSMSKVRSTVINPDSLFKTVIKTTFSAKSDAVDDGNGESEQAHEQSEGTSPCGPLQSVKKSNVKKLTIQTCHLCGTYYASRTKLIQHMQNSHAPKSFKCSQCNKAYGSAAMLKLHQRKHDVSLRCKCSVCDRVCIDKFALRKHMKIHTGEKPHECHVCGKSYLARYALKRHQDTHKGEPLKCPKCNAKFIHQKSYDDHVNADCLGRRKRAKMSSLNRIQAGVNAHRAFPMVRDRGNGTETGKNKASKRKKTELYDGACSSQDSCLNSSTTADMEASNLDDVDSSNSSILGNARTDSSLSNLSEGSKSRKRKAQGRELGMYSIAKKSDKLGRRMVARAENQNSSLEGSDECEEASLTGVNPYDSIRKFLSSCESNQNMTAKKSCEKTLLRGSRVHIPISSVSSVKKSDIFMQNVWRPQSEMKVTDQNSDSQLVQDLYHGIENDPKDIFDWKEFGLGHTNAAKRNIDGEKKEQGRHMAESGLNPRQTEEGSDDFEEREDDFFRNYMNPVSSGLELSPTEPEVNTFTCIKCGEELRNVAEFENHRKVECGVATSSSRRKSRPQKRFFHVQNSANFMEHLNSSSDDEADEEEEDENNIDDNYC